MLTLFDVSLRLPQAWNPMMMGGVRLSLSLLPSRFSPLLVILPLLPPTLLIDLPSFLSPQMMGGGMNGMGGMGMPMGGGMNMNGGGGAFNPMGGVGGAGSPAPEGSETGGGDGQQGQTSQWTAPMGAPAGMQPRNAPSSRGGRGGGHQQGGAGGRGGGRAGFNPPVRFSSSFFVVFSPLSELRMDTDDACSRSCSHSPDRRRCAMETRVERDRRGTGGLGRDSTFVFLSFLSLLSPHFLLFLLSHPLRLQSLLGRDEMSREENRN